MCQSKGYDAPESILWNKFCLHKNGLLSSHEFAKDFDDKDAECHVTHPSVSIDMWSLGCILVELYCGEKLFSSSIDFNNLSQEVSSYRK